MNSQQLIRMVMRMVARKGVSKGIDHVARRGKDPTAMTADEQKQANSSRKSMQQGRRSLQILRRFMRF